MPLAISESNYEKKKQKNRAFREKLKKTKQNKTKKTPVYQTSLSQLAFWFKRSSILIFKMVTILDFQSEQF